MDKILKLNTIVNKRVIKDMYNFRWGVFGGYLEVKDIKICDKTYKTYIYGQSRLYYDRHVHFTKKADWPTANHLYLKRVEEIVCAPKS